MKRVILVCCVLFAVLQPVRTGTPEWLLDARASALGQILSVDNSLANPSYMSNAPTTCLFIDYQSPYLTAELSTLQAGFLSHLKGYDYSLQVSYQGYAKFNEIRCGLAVSKLLKPNFSLAIRLLCYRMDYIGNEDVINRLTADIGLTYQFVNNFRIGVLLINPFRTGYTRDKSKYYLPISFLLGLQYDPVRHCTLLIECVKDICYPFIGKIGFAYRPVDLVELRLGLLTSPFIPTCGIGLRWSKLSCDVASSYHPLLGFSPQIGFKYYF